MLKHILLIVGTLLCVSCNTQKLVIENNSENQHFPIHTNDSLTIQHNVDLNYTEISISNMEKLFGMAYHYWNTPAEDENLFRSIRKTENSQHVFHEWATNGKMWEKIDCLMQTLSEIPRQKLIEKEILWMDFTYFIPLADVSKPQIIKVLILGFSSDLSSGDAKAFIDFAESIPIEFEYQQYKNYTTGYLTYSVPFRVRLSK